MANDSKTGRLDFCRTRHTQDDSEGETNMNSLKEKAAGVTDVIYVILGASGNTGSIIANFLLSKGEKVRVMGRDAGRLQRFVGKGAEAFTANVSDAVALAKAFRGARAAYLLLPPITSREDQERESDAIAKAVRESGLRYAVYLSSYGAQVPEGTGPVAGLHSSEQKLNAISGLNVLHLRAAYFMENNLAAIGMIHGTGIFGHALLPDLKLPMIATPDVGDYAAQRLLHQQVLEQIGMPPKKAAVYIEMFKAINAGVLAAQEPRSPQNSTPTSFDKFVQDVFAPAYQGNAATA